MMKKSYDEYMDAVVLFKPKEAKFTKYNIPDIRPNEVLVKVKAVGVCGSDHSVYEGTFPAPNLPLIQGHEFSGEVTDTGVEVPKSINIDDKVTADINMSCGICYFCRMGQKLLCPDLKQIGLHANGAYAEYVKIPWRQIYKLPETMKWEHGAYVEPLACLLSGQRKIDIQPGSSVLIFGAGPMGLGHTIISKMKGAVKVIVAEINPRRLKKAEDLGADITIDSNKYNLHKEVKKQTNGIGVDYIIEAAGSSDAYKYSFDLVRRGGTILVFGAAPANESITIKPWDLLAKEIKIVSSYAGTYHHWLEAINLISDSRFNPDFIINDKIKLKELISCYESWDLDTTRLKSMVIQL